MLPAFTCTSSSKNLCKNCSGGNILRPFLGIHLPLTRFIKKVDYLSLDCLDDLLF